MGKTKTKQKEVVNEVDQEGEYDYIRIPPDGGYAWVVLIACFVS